MNQPEPQPATPGADPPTSEPGRTGSWLTRHPAVVPLTAAAGLLGGIQAVVMVWRNQALGGWQVASGMAMLGLIAGLLTVLLLSPAVLWLRRRHPRWRHGDPGGATWSVAFALTTAIAAWMIADQWAAGPLVPAWFEPMCEITAALAAAFATTWVRVPATWLKIGAASTPVLWILPVVLGLAAGGPGGSKSEPSMEPETELPQSDVAEPGQPDVVLVSIDTLRADRLGAYGRSPSITPEMDRIAAEGLVFSRALAPAPWTIPSVASMLTGLPAIRHGAGMASSSGPTFLRSPLDPEFVTLAERFAAAGYRTRAVVANGFLSPQQGMDQGFKQFANPLSNAMGAIFLRDLPLVRLLLALIPQEKLGDYRAEGVTATALEFLAEDDDAPLFLWVHYIDPHTPFQADPAKLDVNAWMAEIRQHQPEVLDDGTVVGEVFAGTSHVRGGMLWLVPEDRRRIEEYYDRAVHYVDDHVGKLFANLRARAAKRPVIAALTSDHGEEFWDHGHFEHGHDYYREVTQVPLIFWGPGAVPQGQEESDPVGLVDLSPTLLDLAGLEAPAPEAADEGRSLAPMWRAADRAPGDESPARFAGGNLYDLPAVLLEEGPWRFILRANGHQELYDVIRDPRERYNRVLEHPDLAERYRQALEPRLATFLEVSQDGEATEVSAETLEALRSLGYVQ